MDDVELTRLVPCELRLHFGPGKRLTGSRIEVDACVWVLRLNLRLNHLLALVCPLIVLPDCKMPQAYPPVRERREASLAGYLWLDTIWQRSVSH